MCMCKTEEINNVLFIFLSPIYSFDNYINILPSILVCDSLNYMIALNY